MKTVNEFEARLLRILRCFLGQVSVDQVLALLVQSIDRPRCLSRTCVELIEDFLSKGVTEQLARSGWHHDRFLQPQMVGSTMAPAEPVSGRLWDRHETEVLSLSFSKNTIRWLCWITSQNFADDKSRKKPEIDVDSLTLGDRVLFLLAFEAVQSTLGAPGILKQKGFQDHGLLWLLFPNRIAEFKIQTEPDMNVWFQPDRVWVLEALQSSLCRQWLLLEQNKRRSSNATDLRRTGEIQARTINRYLDAAERADRRDLARFLLMTGQQLIGHGEPPESWFERLDLRRQRMADRSDIYRAGLAFFLTFDRLHQWQQEATAVGFYDENYQASQLWKADWEQWNGDALHQTAHRIIQATDPVRSVTESN